MADNVLILGAGFSRDAGIPLMGSFVERMWEIARRKRSPLDGQILNQWDQELFDQATGLISDLDSYHGRANFDDRNIEDLLSILSFQQLAGGRGSKTSLEKITRAIARTIELTCNVKDRNLIVRPVDTSKDKETPYSMFWAAVFDLYKKHKVMPTLITFNYDLVLERSLIAWLTGSRFDPQWAEKQSPVKSFGVNYFIKSQPVTYGTKAVTYNAASRDRPMGIVGGQKLVPLPGVAPELIIPILKLHGSLNFAKDSKASTTLESVVDDPQILPPLFNKNTAALGSAIWAQALKELREAKNIVVVGYSLPQTDIYMQYFLRAALGPNVDLNKITVYDPCLFGRGNGGDGLKLRYQECFSPQLQRRIEFNPIAAPHLQEHAGTTKHFVYDLVNKPESLMFF